MRAEKNSMVEQIKALIDKKPFFLISYKGLTAAALNGFRNTLFSIGAECHVVKNTLTKRAALELGYKDFENVVLSNDTALVSGDCDAVALAKAVRDFANAQKDFVSIKLGYVENTLVSAAQVVALAELPPREVLLAQLLGLLQAPAAQLVRVLNAKVSSIVYVLNAFLQKKEQTA